MEVVNKKFKDSEVGLIPEDWEVFRIKEKFTVTRGQVLAMPKTNKAKSGLYKYPVYSSQTKDNGLAGYYTDYLFEDAITWTTDGANAGDVKLRKGKFYCTNVCGVLLSSDGYANRCVAEALNRVSNRYVSYVGNPKLMNNVVAGIPIAVPSKLTEQEKISEVITETDSYITALDKLIEKKKKIKTATMQQLLKGEVRLGGYKDEWQTTTVGQLVDFYHGRGLPKSDLVANGKRQCIHYGQLFTEYHEQIDMVASSTNLSENIFESKENDILMPTSDVTPRGLATASCIKKAGIILGGGILVLRPKEDINGSFISYFISNNKNEVLKLVKGSTVFHLYARDITNLEVKLPTSVAEQNEIVEVLEDMKNEINSLQEKRDKLAEMKVGAMHELLTGNIRLV